MKLGTYHEPIRAIIVVASLILLAALAASAAAAAPPQSQHVWVVFKTHFDIGYTDTVADVLRKYRVQMMDNAMADHRKQTQLPPEKRFAWTVPGWPLAHILGPQQSRPAGPRHRQAVREGALAVQALPFSLHTESCELEDLVRGLQFSSQIARDYGQPLPIAAKMTDVPCHSWVRPTLLDHAGMRFLQMGCNGASGHLRVPQLFWWEGPGRLADPLQLHAATMVRRLTAPATGPAKNYLAMIMDRRQPGPAQRGGGGEVCGAMRRRAARPE